MTVERGLLQASCLQKGCLIKGGIKPEKFYLTLTIDTTKTERVGSSPSDSFDLSLQDIGTYNFIIRNKATGRAIKTVTSYLDNRVTFAEGGGVKIIELIGTVKGYRSIPNGADNPKLLGVKLASNFKSADSSSFQESPNLATFSGVLDLSQTTVFAFFFKDNPLLRDIENLNEYDVSGITSFTNELFLRCKFNTFHGDWDTSQWSTKFRMYSEAFNYNQPDNHDHTNVTNFIQYRFNNFAYNQVVNMHIPSAVILSLFMRGCSSQASNITLTGTDLVEKWDQAFHTMTSWFASGAILSISSFAGATTLSQMLFGTRLQTSNTDQILIQLDATISTATGLPLANMVIHLGNSKYSAVGEVALNSLVAKGNTVITGGLEI